MTNNNEKNNEKDKLDYTISSRKLRYFAPAIRTPSLPVGRVGDSYSFSLDIDGTGPYQFSCEGLPEGMWLSESGTILGSPTVSGEFLVRIFVQNAVSKHSRAFHMKVFPVHEAPPTITTTSLPPGRVGRSYVAALSASSSAVWSSRNLPKGLVLDHKTGLVTGYPRDAGVHTAYVTASNAYGEYTRLLGIEIL